MSAVHAAIDDKISVYGSYSTTERFTGKYWIDGKPIYRIAYEILKNNTLSSGWTRSGSTFTSTDGVFSIMETMTEYRAYTDVAIIIGYGAGTTNEQYDTGICYQGSNKIKIINSSRAGWTGNNCVLVVEYTKTTDPTP